KCAAGSVRTRGIPDRIRSSSLFVFLPTYRTVRLLLTAYLVLCFSYVFAEDLNLQDLIDEALKNNHEILITESRVAASEYRIPQVKSLPDPMLMFGYQNEGWKKYTYGESIMAWWMFSASQTFPFPGKLSTKGEMAARETEGLRASYEGVRLRTIEKVKELYYDLLYTYKTIDIINERAALFTRIEDAAIARYSSGKGMQQEVLMAQTEKYMLLEKEQMLKQRIQSLEAMLNSTIGRDINAPLGRPVEIKGTGLETSLNELLTLHVEHSPFVKEKERMVASAQARVRMAELDYYPDFTVNAGYFNRGSDFDPMWSLTTTINIPIFYRTKQRQAVNEARALLSGAEHELDSTKIMLSSTIRDNYSMARTAERLMELYKSGLIPKTYQDFESALSGYGTGRVDEITVITRLKTLLDLEISYWGQFTEREKAIARLQSITGIAGSGDKEK
ncbi:MAG TPA: TolC family protein, partial [Thermodesulfovibrionales bacterium]|nr:TolC family protein [Thermodesulfovibrionales bacterium]